MKSQTGFRSLILLFCVVAVSAVATLRRVAPEETLASTRAEIPRLEYFASASSFSEVEQMRAQLRALARRYLYSMQIRQVEALRHSPLGSAPKLILNNHARTPAGSPGRPSLGAAPSSDLAREVRDMIQEFRGTGEEPVLTQGLLTLLASERAYGQWLDHYLELLYRRPTEEVVCHQADTAVAAGNATGRLGEVLAAFRHVSRIPLEFEGKRRLRELLAEQEQATLPTPSLGPGPGDFHASTDPGPTASEVAIGAGV